MKPPIPPLVEPPDKETMEMLKYIDHKKFEQSDAFKKYVQPVLDREKQQKSDKRAKWWKNNWINLITLVVSVLTLIATIVFGLIQVL